MRRTRPPFSYSTAVCCVLLLMTVTGGLGARQLILPDLVLPGYMRPDILQPDEFDIPGEDWSAGRPRYRRLYPLAALESLDVPMVPVEITGIADVSAYSGSESVEKTIPPGTEEYSRGWYAGGSYNLREGAGITAGYQFSDVDILGVEAFLPLAISPLRPWVAGLEWQRHGMFSGEVRAGARIDGNTVPYGLADMRWDRPLGSPDSYQLYFASLGGPSGGLGGRLGVKLDFPVGTSGWSLGSDFGGSGWYGGSTESWNADLALWTGVIAAEGRLHLKFGLHGLIDGGMKFRLSPYLNGVWRPRNDMTVFVDGSWRFEGVPSDTLVYEAISSFDSEVPAHAIWNLGMTAGREGRFLSSLNAKVGYGRYAHGNSDDIIVEDDIQSGVHARMEIPPGLGIINIIGDLDYFFTSGLLIWSAEIGWKVEEVSVFFRSGTEDAILGGGLPGIRSEMPIIGLGTDWLPGEKWEIGVFAYAGMPWYEPSLALYVNWRN